MNDSAVMTRDVLSIRPEATILEAARLMLQNRISGLPVINAYGELVGILTEGDFLRRSETGTQRKRPRWLEFLIGPGRLADEYVHTTARKVEEVMTERVYTVEEDAPLEKIVHVMERHRVKRLPVIKNGKMVGIVTRANLMRALAMLALEARPASASDTAIRERLMADLEKEPWAPLATIDVAVTNGVVKLTGALTDERERQALRVAAENIPGVKNVEDHLIWVEPTSGTIIEAPEDLARRER
jgi:CBS domain-containing protein